MRGAKAPPKGGKMKINKRLLSFFLAVLMVFTTFGETVFLYQVILKPRVKNQQLK